MARYGSGFLTTAGSTTLPICALVGSANKPARLRELGFSNTTATACAVKLARISTAGTPGTAGANAPLDLDATAAVSSFRNTYSSTAPTLGNDLGYRYAVPAAIGAGTIWTFEDWKMVTLLAANAAIALMVENGTGQALQVYAIWDE